MNSPRKPRKVLQGTRKHVKYILPKPKGQGKPHPGHRCPHPRDNKDQAATLSGTPVPRPLGTTKCECLGKVLNPPSPSSQDCNSHAISSKSIPDYPDHNTFRRSLLGAPCTEGHLVSTDYPAK